MKHFLVLALIFFVITGCEGGDGSSGLQAIAEGGQGSGSSQDQVAPPAPALRQGGTTALQGTWRKACGANDEFFDVVTLTFRGDQFSTSIENYTDSRCSIPLEYAPNPTATGRFSLGREVILSDGVTATEMDRHISQFNGAPFDIHEYSVVHIKDNVMYHPFDDEAMDNPQHRPDTLDFSRAFKRVNRP